MSKKPVCSADLLSAFCCDLGGFLRRGHSLTESFAAMAAAAAAPQEERLYLRLMDGVRKGTLTEALQQAEVFPDYMRALIERGEREGNTEQALATLCTYFERERIANTSVHGRAVYPAVMAALAVGILIITGGFVLPVFADQFAALGLTFSPFARGAMKAGRVLTGVAGIALTLTAFGMVFLWFMLQRSHLHLFRRMPLSSAIAAGRFTAALAMLSRGGMDDQTALAEAEALVQHPSIAQAVPRMQTAMEKGETLPYALAGSGLITGTALDRLRAQGNADFLLDEAAARLATDISARMTRLLIRVEPVVVLALSGAAGVILLSVMLPLLGGLAVMR